jgi:hypothetical protein
LIPYFTNQPTAIIKTYSRPNPRVPPRLRTHKPALFNVSLQGKGSSLNGPALGGKHTKKGKRKTKRR